MGRHARLDNGAALLSLALSNTHLYGDVMTFLKVTSVVYGTFKFAAAF